MLKYIVPVKKKFSSRGFIGPIGDDLPSLIPLLFGLIIFFSTFSLALSSFEVRNKDIQDKLEALEVSRILRSDGLINGYADFQRLCAMIPKVSIKYHAGLIDLSPSGKSVVFASQLSLLANEGTPNEVFACTSASVEEGELDSLDVTRSMTLVYPIAVEQHDAVLPVHLVVVAWQ